MPADQPAPEAAARAPPGARGRSPPVPGPPGPAPRCPRAAGDGAPPAKRPPAKKAAGQGPAKSRSKPTIAPSPGAGEGAVLTAVATDGSAVAVVDAGPRVSSSTRRS